jgi:hypothetical protein
VRTRCCRIARAGRATHAHAHARARAPTLKCPLRVCARRCRRAAAAAWRARRRAAPHACLGGALTRAIACCAPSLPPFPCAQAPASAAAGSSLRPRLPRLERPRRRCARAAARFPPRGARARSALRMLCARARAQQACVHTADAALLCFVSAFRFLFVRSRRSRLPLALPPRPPSAPRRSRAPSAQPLPPPSAQRCAPPHARGRTRAAASATARSDARKRTSLCLCLCARSPRLGSAAPPRAPSAPRPSPPRPPSAAWAAAASAQRRKRCAHARTRTHARAALRVSLPPCTAFLRRCR